MPWSLLLCTYPYPQLLELVPPALAPLTHGGFAVAVATGEAPAPTPAAGDGPGPRPRHSQQLSGPPSAGPFGSQGLGSLQQQQDSSPIGSHPRQQHHSQHAQQQQQQQLSDARLARVRRAVRLLQRDMDVAGGEDQVRAGGEGRPRAGPSGAAHEMRAGAGGRKWPGNARMSGVGMCSSVVVRVLLRGGRGCGLECGPRARVLAV